jgi:preprotein translocase subunit SecG
MASFIIVIIVIIAALLGLIVLVQNPKGGGLAVGFQGTSQVGGVQRTADFLEKATWYLAIAMFALCLISAAWFNTKTTSSDDADSATPTEQTQGGDQPADGSQQPAQ